MMAATEQAKHTPGPHWMVVAVAVNQDAWIVSADAELSRDLDGRCPEDNGVEQPKGLAPGLYFVAGCHVYADEDEFYVWGGDWRLAKSIEAARATPAKAEIKAASDAYARTHDWVTGQGALNLQTATHEQLKAILEAAICDARNHYFERGQFDFDGEAASWCATLLLAARGQYADNSPAEAA